MRICLTLLALAFLFSCAQRSAPLPSDPLRSNRTFTYEEGLAWWDSLAAYSDLVALVPFGITDAGKPLHLAILSNTVHDLDQLRKQDRSILLINNAIHPGEPDGVDASMRYYRDLVLQGEAAVLDSVIVVCIPFYNIGGTLIRNSHTRANQEGPVEYGFRGNAQNLDLNRDFIKCDSRNALSFARLIQILDPDVYLETHVSNGADYQYTMTYLASQPEKLGFGMGRFLREQMIPDLEAAMLAKGQEMVPYVNVHGHPLDSAYAAFYDSPRYSTGFLSLHQIYGLLTETHMLKPYDERVKATHQMIECLVQFSAEHASDLRRSRSLAKASVQRVQQMELDWELDSSAFRSLDFKGYAWAYRPSELNGVDRLYYDRGKPAQIPIKYYDRFKPRIQRTKPKAYVLRGGYADVVERLRVNGVYMEHISQPAQRRATRYRITEIQTSPSPFESHYLHYDTRFEADTTEIVLYEGDLLIPMGHSTDRFVMEVLEPDAPDSYFNWNFFDAILQQKEWYSPYVFEDRASALLRRDSSLHHAFAQAKESGAFEHDTRAALHWVYTHSPHYEPTHMVLPIFRIEN